MQRKEAIVMLVQHGLLDSICLNIPDTMTLLLGWGPVKARDILQMHGLLVIEPFGTCNTIDVLNVRKDPVNNSFMCVCTPSDNMVRDAELQCNINISELLVCEVHV